jgi:hypothetical protein
LADSDIFDTRRGGLIFAHREKPKHSQNREKTSLGIPFDARIATQRVHLALSSFCCEHHRMVIAKFQGGLMYIFQLFTILLGISIATAAQADQF